MDEDKLLSTPEAAEDIGVDTATLWRWQKAGKVKPAWTTPGGKIKWDPIDLRRQLGLPAAPRPIVLAIVTCTEGVLVGKRRDGKPAWTFIGGELEPMETPEQCAVREVQEEAKIRIMASSAGPIGERVHPKTGRTMIYMPCAPVGDTTVEVGDEEELEEVRWVPLSEAEELLPHLYEPVLVYLAKILREPEV
ncbi:NUDIX domain-containing protein [Glycomyces sp. MUSA5-2]|uniref:NUDIX domain-containing protein n=1 Tax=Glycomyces sp. MUSA5-2 TaxID=2053002 RepID=UPI0030081781